MTEWLAREGLTQEDFAKRIGHDQSYVSRLCRRVTWPRPDVIVKIRAATGGAVTADDLMPGTV